MDKIDPKKESFYERLLGVIQGASYVQKKGKNKEQNYNYAMEADFLELVKPLLIKAGIVPIPTYTVIGNEQVQTQAGKPANLVTVDLSLILQDAYSAERVVVQSIGQGRDPQDKACYKAMTGAMKYALAKAFLVPTGDDPEEESEETPANTKASGKEKDQAVAFMDAVTAIRYKLSDTVFQKVLKDFGCTQWPDHALILPITEQRALYKALQERVPK